MRMMILISVAGLSAISTGCASTAIEEAASASAEKAVAESATVLPAWPPYCRKHIQKVVPKLGEPVWGTQKRWEIVMENGNDKIDWCAGYYDEVAASVRNAAPVKAARSEGR